MAILKAGAYGHGLEEIANYLEATDIAIYGVASVIEARRLSAIGVTKPVYLLGPTFAEERQEIVQQRWIPSLSSLEEAKHFHQLNEGKEKLPVHLTVDTGMGRGGYLPKQLKQEIDELLDFSNLLIEGIGSHLPSADEDRAFTEGQFERFDGLVELLSNKIKFKYIHLSNSAGTLAYASRTTNLVRPGLMLYGISPLEEYQHLLKPVMSLKSRVSLVRSLPKGQGISYGRSHILEKESRVATVGIGYGDGYSRHFSNKGAEVVIRGQRCPVIGRVTMDQIMVDVSSLATCESGDEVELYGEQIIVSELAKKSAMIAWEILTGIKPRVTRMYL